MEHLRLREYHNIIVEKHPHYQSLNKKLIEDAKELNFYSPEENNHYTNIRGTQYNISRSEETSSMKVIVNWVTSLILDSMNLINYSAQSRIYMWFARYNEGDYTISHTHQDMSIFGFVYFVNAPSGAAPLVFTTSGRRIKAESGKMGIFPAPMRHHVPKNRCKDRLVLVGNVIFDGDIPSTTMTHHSSL